MTALIARGIRTRVVHSEIKGGYLESRRIDDVLIGCNVMRMRVCESCIVFCFQNFCGRIDSSHFFHREITLVLERHVGTSIRARHQQLLVSLWLKLRLRRRTRIGQRSNIWFGCWRFGSWSFVEPSTLVCDIKTLSHSEDQCGYMIVTHSFFW